MTADQIRAMGKNQGFEYTRTFALVEIAAHLAELNAKLDKMIDIDWEGKAAFKIEIPHQVNVDVAR